MRPLGLPAQVLLHAAIERPGTVGDLAARCQVGREVAKRTLDNLFRAGKLVEVGAVVESDRNRPKRVYGPAEHDSAEVAAADANCGIVLMMDIMRRWPGP